jgi:hypothetical protein
MGSRLIKLPPLHDRSCRDWNQRTVIVEYALPRSLGTNNNLTVDLSQRISVQPTAVQCGGGNSMDKWHSLGQSR